MTQDELFKKLVEITGDLEYATVIQEVVQSHIREVLEQIKKKHTCDTEYCVACEDNTPVEELRKAFGLERAGLEDTK